MQGRDRLVPGHTAKRSIDLQSLEVFVMVCETGNMTSAGKILGMTQSAVSQVIKNLEDQLGVILFDRKLRPVAITAAGTKLSLHAHQLLQDADHMIGSVRNLGTTIIPHFRLGIVTTVAGSIGPKLVSNIYGKATELSVFSAAAPVLQKALVRRNADIIITTEDIDNLDTFESHRLLQEPYLLVMSSKCAEHYGGCSLQELAQSLPLIRYSALTSAGKQIERHLRRIQLDPLSSLKMDTAEAIVGIVLNDLGWTITTPLALLRSLVHAEDLHIVPFPAPSFSRTLTLVSRRGELLALPKEIAACCQMLLRQDVIPKLEERISGITEKMLIGPI